MDKKIANVMKKITELIIVLTLISPMAFAQKASLKTNLLYSATTTPNLAFEVSLSNKTSLDLSACYTSWELGDNRKLKHFMIAPELRWWLCETFNGSFIGVHLLGGEYNAGGIKFPLGILPTLQSYRYEGYFFGSGFSIGHQWMLSNRWSIEATLGLGYIRTVYDKYPCEKCGKKIKSDSKDYLGPTKATISLIYYLW